MSSSFPKSSNEQHIVVVLGMHRSGTSSLTRGLKVLGVDLGANLFGGIEGNNDKGFFEDVDVNNFNVELLGALGRNWHSLEPIGLQELNSSVIQEFKLRAVQLLRSKVNSSPCFGLKDPRITRLLPFWSSVFEHLKLRVSYVIAFRHPMSVARSLQRRDEFELEKGYLLWVDHMLASLRDTSGCARVVVEYDRLMAQPELELQRIATAFKLDLDSKGKSLAEYKIGFLDSSLRHTEFQPEDLLVDPLAPAVTIELYQLLLALSEDRIALDAEETKRTVDNLAQQWKHNYPILRFLDRKDTELISLKEVLDVTNGQLASLAGAIVQKDNEIEGCSQAIFQRDGHIASLNEAIAQYEEKVIAVNEIASQYGENINALNRELLGRKQEIEVLNQSVSQRDALESSLAELQSYLHASNVEVKLLEAKSRDFEHLILQLNSSIETVSHERDGLLQNLEDSKAELVTALDSFERVIDENERLHVQTLVEFESLAAVNRQALEQNTEGLVGSDSAIDRKICDAMENTAVNDNDLNSSVLLDTDISTQVRYISDLEASCEVAKQEISDLESKVYYAWKEVDELKNANAEARYKYEVLIGSASWRITAPLRFAWLHLVIKPRAYTKGLIVRCLRACWRALPVSSHSRFKLKNVLYTTLPFVFGGTENYKQWKFYSDARKSTIESQELAKDSVSVSAIEQAAVAGIPRIQFDSTQNQFVEHRDNPAIEPVVKLIAFYLPQFHPFPQNDEWWGKGFTEWTNVTKAFPNYVDHYQPHYPIHNGYYDLRVAEVMEEQARLAKEYGVYGFSYYFYWFAGTILMDRPLEQMLANPKVEMPFCFTWANENWSRRWDGQENDILIAQHHSDSDSLDFIRHLIKYFKDDRYIKIDGKPLLIIYRASIIPDMEKTALIWRQELENNGFPGLYLVCAQSFGIKSPEEFGFDASVEFPPHTVSSTDVRHELQMSNTEFNGHIFSYDQVVANAVASKEPDYKLFRASMLSWDNTARKQHNSHTFHGFSLLRYKQWLSSITNNVFNNAKYSKDEKLVFVNAWNEWAEGTHLEPDRKYGYGYLQATYDVLAEYDMSKVSRIAFKCSVRQADYAVVLHLHYEDLWEDIKSYLDSFGKLEYDLYVTVTSSSVGVRVAQEYPKAHIQLVENRGRDVLPFLKVLQIIKDMGYIAVCKIHSKRSLYRDDGDKIRGELIGSLLGSNETVLNVVSRFSQEQDIGVIVPVKYLIPHTDHNMTYCGAIVAELSSKLGLDFSYSEFVAGSMFWFRPKALEGLFSIDESSFEVEDGLADGTLAHGIERILCDVVRKADYKVETI
ncbi:glycoside hydrolase family 99-like domain-containing protein [Pseudomonas paraveronii]|uniref:glycoside hydrolase family 99-like domain-containing protein n=1 Tax=Pseudomonas paraveronii TaxID=3040598 RepID=UPI002AB205BD|nr:glycoside hydrolase family 99-like domain-containing protein [Pseudomonas sp. V3/K/3/5]